MSEISNLIFKASKKILKEMLDIKCKEYEQEFITKIEIRENKKLVGVIIYFDWQKVRYLLEWVYIGKNKKGTMKYWFNIFRDKNILILKATVQKVNLEMLIFLKNRKFKIITEDEFNFFLEYRR